MARLSRVCGVLVLLAFPACVFTHRLSQRDLQERLSQRFPVTRSATVASITLQNPLVTFPGEDGQLGLRLTVEGRGMGLSANATVQVEGRVTYNAETGSFFLNEPRTVKLLSVSGAEGESAQRPIDGPLGVVLATAVPAVVNEVLNTVPVYTLDPAKRDEARVKAHLRSVRVRDQSLIIEFN